jgi:two-component system sensor histidine kinase HupT/HoxJ
MIDSSTQHSSPRLTDQVGLSTELQKQAHQAEDHAWIEVIQRMDEIYADLVRYQVELELKNKALEDAQNFIQSVISGMSEILIVCDINGKIQQVNQALTDSMGLDSEQLLSKPVSTLFDEKYIPLIAEFPEHIRSGTLIDCEVELINAERQSVPMAINCNARFDHDNTLSGLVITGRPLGELRKAYQALKLAHEELKTTQQQLIQSEKMASLGRLVAGVAHELNNPISFLYANMFALKGYQSKISTYIDAVHADVDQAERERLRQELRIDKIMTDIAPLVEGSMEGAERVSQIVANLRKFSTPQEQSHQSLDLIMVIKRAISWVLQASSLSIDVTHDYPPQLTINNNEGHIHQILINLFQNALDAMQQTEKPQLEIRLLQDDEQVHIHIIDNGHGIRKENLFKVFDPFFTTKGVGVGTGLGLSISYGLATEQCMGNLQAKQAQDNGAEFILSLPIKDSL